MTIEAMKQWLEALEKSQSALAEELSAWDIDPPLHHVQDSHDLCGPAITALRQAIAEVEKKEQELDYKAIGQQAYESGYTTGYMDGAIKAHEAKKERCTGCEACIDSACGRDECPKGWAKAQPKQEPVAICEHCEKERPVIHAPQREWVGLTDEEIEDIFCDVADGDYIKTGRLIEAKLKEKNT
jgi:hypothetical protein